MNIFAVQLFFISMYEYITGTLSSLTPTYAIVEAAGVGYYINISLQTYSEIEGREQVRLYTHFIVREDAQILYGFHSSQERELFRKLISVSGVGGNTARMILSTYSTGELLSIISSENARLLKNVKGLGLKTSEKIIVELKDKMGDIAALPAGTIQSDRGMNEEVYSEALSALTMLGFPKAASDKVLKNILKESPDTSVEQLVRLSLKHL